MSTFRIGTGVSVDLDTLINSRLLVQANSGAGKSWALRRLLEQSHGHVQHLIIDPEGEFASLREKYDYVLAAKSGGDTLADVRTAKLLAERLLELGGFNNPRGRLKSLGLIEYSQPGYAKARPILFVE